MGNTSSSDGGHHGHHHHHHHHQHSSSSASGGHHGSSSGSGSSSASKVKNFMRSTGVLGLSRSELDERCKPSGLYPSCQWEDKAIRKLIGDGKLASRLKGTENRSTASDRECPICFLHYAEVNVTKCCQANICTECYLQVRPQKEKSPCCPFCNHSRISVSIAKAMGAEDIMTREEDEQRVIEAKIRQRVDKGGVDKKQSASTTDDDKKMHYEPDNKNDFTTPTKSAASQSCSAFGSSLEKCERVASLRARTSSSFSDSDKAANDDVIASLAMTPEERRAIEEEMRAQHSHPLSLKIEAEAEERRNQNEREFYRAQGSRLLELRARSMAAGGRRNRMYQNRLSSDPGISLLFPPESSSSSGGGGHYQSSRRRDWNQIVDAFERGGNGEVNSLDDLVVLEAAMILSMEEEARRRGNGSSGTRNNNESGDGDDNNGSTFDASRHAGEGFPLLRSLLAGRQSSSASRDTTTTTASDGSATSATATSDDASNEQQATTSSSSIARTLGGSSRRRGRNTLLRAYRGGSLNTALDTASLLMRGISEEEQLAMAIAASLQEQSESGNDGEDNIAEDGVSNADDDAGASASAGLGNIAEGTEHSSSNGEGLSSHQHQDEQQRQPIQSEAVAAGAAEEVSSSASDYESTSEHLEEQQGCSDSAIPNANANSALLAQNIRDDDDDVDNPLVGLSTTAAEL